MAKKKKAETVESPKKNEGYKIKGKLKFGNLDQQAARMDIQGAPELLNTRILKLDTGVLPKDFEPDLYDVTGTYEFVIKATPKK